MTGSKKNLQRARALLGAMLYLTSVGLVPTKRTNEGVMPTLSAIALDKDIKTEDLIQSLSTFSEKIIDCDINKIAEELFVEEIDGNKVFYTRQGFTPYCVEEEKQQLYTPYSLGVGKAGLLKYISATGDLDGYISLNIDCQNFISITDRIKKQVFEHDPELTKEVHLIFGTNSCMVPPNYTLCELTSFDPNEKDNYIFIKMKTKYTFIELPYYENIQAKTYNGLKSNANYVCIRNDVLELIRANEKLESRIKAKYESLTNEIKSR